MLVVGLGGTAGLRAAEDELVGSLRRAGATVALERARPPREVRTFMATDLVWARAARAAAQRGIERHAPRAIVYSTVTAALLWPRPGAIRFDAPPQGNRPGRHGLWQRPLARRRLAESPLLVPQSQGALDEAGRPATPGVIVPIPVEPSGPPATTRPVAAVTYASDPHKKGLDLVQRAWAAAHREGEELAVRRFAAPDEFRALLRQARVYVTAPRREDYGLVQLEALADGCVVVSTPAPGPYAALPLLRELDRRLVVGPDGLGLALRTALDDPVAGYAERALELLAPYRRDAVDRTVADLLLPALLSA